MPTPVTPKVFLIARTQVLRDEVAQWLRFLGVSDEFELPPTSDPAALVALAAKRCYKSFEPGLNPNVTKVRQDYADYFDNILKSGHGSVLEHAVYSYAIENVSRVFTAEMNRHRAGWAISEQSLRYVRFDEIPYALPTCIRGPDVLQYYGDRLAYEDASVLREWLRTKASEWSLEQKKHAHRLLLHRAFELQEAFYELMQILWAEQLAPESRFALKKQITSLMRRHVGMGVATGGVWTGNIRALRHVLTMRCDPAAEEEILEVFSGVAANMAHSEPLMFGDFEQVEGYWRPRYRKV